MLLWPSVNSATRYWLSKAIPEPFLERKCRRYFFIFLLNFKDFYTLLDFWRDLNFQLICLRFCSSWHAELLKRARLSRQLSLKNPAQKRKQTVKNSKKSKFQIRNPNLTKNFDGKISSIFRISRNVILRQIALVKNILNGFLKSGTTSKIKMKKKLQLLDSESWKSPSLVASLWL